MKASMAILLLALAPVAGVAQEPRDLPDLPREVEDRVRELRSDPGAVHMTGPVTIPLDSTVAGSLVVDGGTLTLSGHARGDVLVLHGDLVLGAGSRVDGDVLVVGGEILGIDAATVGGTLLAYGAAGPSEARPERRDDARDRHDHDDERRRRRHDDEGGFELGLSIPGSYNRVEGLPVMFGPVIETRGPNRLHLAGQAIWRTNPSSSLEDDIGWQVRVEQGLFGDQLRIGGDVGSMVHAIETRGLNSTEAGLAAAIFHSDPHDYFHREGWAARLELRPHRSPFGASLEYRQSEHVLLRVSDPWSLFRGDDDWRLQPVVAQGDVSTLGLSLGMDTRDDEDEPVQGLLARIGLERTLDQDLAMPSIDLDGTVGSGRAFDDFTVARVDLRVHMPVNRSSTLNLRAFAAGTMSETALPPQFQRGLGGIGTLPGFDLFQGACGSRDNAVSLVTVDTTGANVLSDQRLRPSYGCDRVVLGQLEYRGGFGFGERDRDRDDDDEWWGDWKDVDLEADWSFFVDVAQGWSFGNLTFADRSDTETMADVGIGLLFDQLGVYAALPITGDDQSLRVVARLQRRF